MARPTAAPEPLLPSTSFDEPRQRKASEENEVNVSKPAGKAAQQLDLKIIPPYFAWVHVEDPNRPFRSRRLWDKKRNRGQRHMSMFFRKLTHLQSLKDMMKQNLHRLAEVNRNLQTFQRLHTQSKTAQAPISEEEKKRRICKENIEVLRSQLMQPSRPAIAAPTPRTRHVQFDIGSDKHHMPTDVKSTLESHLKTRLIDLTTKHRRLTLPLPSRRVYQRPATPITKVRPAALHSTPRAPTIPNAPPRSMEKLEKHLKQRHRYIVRHRTNKPIQQPKTSHPPPRKLIYFKEGHRPKASASTLLPQANVVPHLALAAVRRPSRRPTLRRLQNPIFLFERYPPYGPRRHYVTEYQDKFRPPSCRQPRSLLLVSP
ncbi:Aste57867_13907 [Aphanomyces stellatus]|uniref:Aste57867_13907 protein n=1 Tax=Aphanomyces stellatus TaxID=120398 RepID=A0A485KZA9_9STRA|nr:hypothetical protein As57867_013856 [Aphanomyces stellatus]VFT90738.1 Aste57867_13907 [Aphanomyces stellatus]